MNDPDERKITVRVPDKSEIISFVIGLVPFVCNFSTTSTTTLNNRVVSKTSIHYVALVCGALVILAAYNSFRLLGETADSDRNKRLALIMGLVVLGGFQLLRGVGAAG